MVEQIQTNPFAELEAYNSNIQTQDIPTVEEEEEVTIPVKEEEVIPTPIQEENPFAELEALNPTAIQTQEENPFAELISLNPTTEYDPNKYSTAEKIRYGIDKQNTFFGNLYRVAKAATQAAFDPEKEFKEYAKYNAQKEKLLLEQKYGDLASGAYDDDSTVQAAAMATMLTDPFYIAAYMTPWGRIATGSMKGIAALSGVTVGLDKLLDNLATTGQVKASEVAITAASASVLGPLSVKAIRGISSLLPNASTAQVEKIVKVIEGQKAKQLGVSKPEFKKLQLIAGDKEVLEINKQLQVAGKNWLKPIAEQSTLFNATEKTLENKIKKISTQLKDSKSGVSKKYIKELNTLLTKKKKNLLSEREEFTAKQNVLWKDIAKESKIVSDLTSKRDYIMLKKLKESQSLSKNTAQAVISATIRPAMGAGIGYTFGKLWGEDDANLNNWMMTGAALGGLNKLVQRSGTVFATGEKNFLEKIIYNDATRLSFQKVRELTSTTTSTKLKAIGGETEQIGAKLFQELDSPISKFSASAISDKLKQDYGRRAFKLIANTSAEEQNAAVRIARGSKEKGTTKVKKLASDIRKFLDDFRKEYTDVGIGLRRNKLNKEGKEIKNKKGEFITERIDPLKDYFPRVWNWDAVKKDPKKFVKVLTDIYKSKGAKDPEKQAESFYRGLSKSNDKGVYNKDSVQELIQATASGNKFNKSIIRDLPLSDHINKDRVLSGSYAQVEKVLNSNGYLINDVPSILNNLIATSADSIAFAKNFGTRGELLKPYIQGIVKKYKDIDLKNNTTNAVDRSAEEIALVMKSINGFFGRHGEVKRGIVKSGAGILTTIANLNMLDRVTIASLGDLVQPFTNSNNFQSWIRGFFRTAIQAKNESGIAKNMGLAQGKEIQQALLKTLSPLDDATNAANIMGAVPRTTGDKVKKNLTLRGANEIGFKYMGLQWLTGFARRYAYNTAAIDAYTSSRKLAVFVSQNNSLSSGKGLRLIQDVNKYGIDLKDALKLGKINKYDEAIKTKLGKNILNDAGISGANRDALIPQVSNRLLFTQSRDPAVRLMGQFMSWTLAKSAQTNKLVQRIENGDTRQLVKLLAGLPVYGGIQELREIAKYGEVRTDIETQTDSWFAEAVRLSGIGGTLPELVIGRLTGPAAREPWYLFAPSFSILTDAGDMGKEAVKGNTDRATQIFLDKIAPLPTWRRWIAKLFPDNEINKPAPKSSVNQRIGFDDGGSVTKPPVVVENPMLDEASEQSENPLQEKVDQERASKEPLLVTEYNVPQKKPTDIQMAKLIETKQKPVVVKEEAVYSLPKNVDMKFLEQVEGNKNDMYVPKDKQGIALGKSGPTIGMGFDVGGRNENDLKGLPPEIIKKLKPYLGLRKQEAIDFIEKNPLVITDKEKVIINAFAKKVEMEKLRKKWKETTGKSFDDLNSKAATVVASVAFQYGDLETRTPNFWKQVTAGDWEAAKKNLYDFGDKYKSRRKKEAELLEGLFEKGDR